MISQLEVVKPYEKVAIKLSIEQDIAPEYEQYMQRTWPLALQRLKTLCEVS